MSKWVAEDITFKDDNAVSRLSVRDILYANAYEMEYPSGLSEYVINRDEAIKYLMELPSVAPKSDNSVFEDIKAEIESKEVEVEFMNDWRRGYNSAIYDVIRVIDKYISGKEQADGSND